MPLNDQDLAKILSGGESETVEFKINFLRSVREGRVSAEALAVHIGRRTHVWQVTAHDEQGRQLALASRVRHVFLPLAVVAFGIGAVFGLLGTFTLLVQDWSAVMAAVFVSRLEDICDVPVKAD